MIHRIRILLCFKCESCMLLILCTCLAIDWLISIKRLRFCCFTFRVDLYENVCFKTCVLSCAVNQTVPTLFSGSGMKFEV